MEWNPNDELGLGRSFVIDFDYVLMNCEYSVLGTMDLEDRALKQFDRLIETGGILWEENDVRIVDAEPFNASKVSLKANATASVS